MSDLGLRSTHPRVLVRWPETCGICCSPPTPPIASQVPANIERTSGQRRAQQTHLGHVTRADGMGRGGALAPEAGAVSASPARPHPALIRESAVRAPPSLRTHHRRSRAYVLAYTAGRGETRVAPPCFARTDRPRRAHPDTSSRRTACQQLLGLDSGHACRFGGPIAVVSEGRCRPIVWHVLADPAVVQLCRSFT